MWSIYCIYTELYSYIYCAPSREWYIMNMQNRLLHHLTSTKQQMELQTFVLMKHPKLHGAQRSPVPFRWCTMYNVALTNPHTHTWNQFCNLAGKGGKNNQGPQAFEWMNYFIVDSQVTEVGVRNVCEVADSGNYQAPQLCLSDRPGDKIITTGVTAWEWSVTSYCLGGQGKQ